MSEERLKQICKEEFLNNIKENIKSETIFIYVDGLEKENKKQKEVLDKIKKYCNKNTLIDRFYNDKIPFEVIVNELNRLLEVNND